MAPIQQHLLTYDGEDAEPVELALRVLALLPMVGRLDAAAVLRGYAIDGPHWSTALEAIGDSGAMKLPTIWDGLADGIIANRDDAQLVQAIWCDTEPWTTFAQSQPRVRRIIDELKASRSPGPARRATRPEIAAIDNEDLIGLVAAGGFERLRALEELGRRGDRIVFDFAEDPGLRNAAGWLPGIPQALHHLGPDALPRARTWIGSGDDTLVAFGERVVAEVGDQGDAPVLLAALHRTVVAGEWCAAEVPARGRAGWGSVKPRASSWPRGKARCIHLPGKRSWTDFGDARRMRPKPSWSRDLTIASQRFSGARVRQRRILPRSARVCGS